MHTASLFSDAADLVAAFANNTPVLLVPHAKGAGEPRISLNEPVLRGAITTNILYVGNDKNIAQDKACELNDPRLAPILAFVEGAVIHWMVK